MGRGWVVVSRPDLGFMLCHAKRKFSHIQSEKNRGKFSLQNAQFSWDQRNQQATYIIIVGPIEERDHF